MNEPIISPWLIYWAGRIEFIQVICCVVGLVVTAFAVTATIGQVQGAVLKVADCIVAVIKTVGESIRDKYGDKSAVAVVHNIAMKALQLIYKDSKKE